MSRKWWKYFVLAVSICLAVAATALAAAVTYKAGSYKGTTAQKDPSTKKPIAITFRISNGTVSKVLTKTIDKCPDGSTLRVNQNAFTSATISSKGRFTLRAGNAQQPAVMKGTVSGSTASGTITDKTKDTASSSICKGSTTWTAKLKKKK
jgi:hypothetical protein